MTKSLNCILYYKCLPSSSFSDVKEDFLVVELDEDDDEEDDDVLEEDIDVFDDADSLSF